MNNLQETIDNSPIATREDRRVYQFRNVFKFFFFSAVGIFMFFIPIEMNDKSSIPLDHLVTWLRSLSSTASAYYAMILVFLGAAYPFYTKTWRKNKVEMVLSGLKILGAIAAFLVLFELGPAWLMAEEMGPYWYYSLLIPIGVLVPIGAIFLAMLVGYGLLEFIGIFMQPIMRPIWRTPGRSAIDAVASFVGSYSIGLLITNRIYKEGKYTKREATIIATGFSTVSATFMIVVAKTLDIMHIWNLYFWLTFLVTFVVTAITVRIWPINKISDDYYTEEGFPEEIIKENRIKHAWEQAMITAHNTPKLKENIYVNVKDGLVMAMGILPSIMSIGLFGLILANHTPVFDYLGYIFYPLTWVLQIPEPFLAAKAAAINLIDMFLPSLVVLQASLETRFIIGSLSISTILFFSALIPCILSTEIPIKMSHILTIWFLRTVLTLIIVTPLTFLFL
ncbi:YjiH family protein [Psychrobacillus lasiicapitis]|uniref:YjiH family protein n=1 Tax=Psychrobacillus lasiicapitis TaxID=1636719 RepID=A0A544T8X0_9BACI|nr:YjiH family protein [Psychrobacillus lasiicapitis]TQR13900.1 YjiH family protein [Psychrobacillus lasiicapitis]GGA36377.1 histidine transporter [Psychrobacillus lasiicapitis]